MAWLAPAEWSLPPGVKAFSTRRRQGNLALHTQDNPCLARQHRAQLVKSLDLPSEPVWMNQTHSTRVIAGHDARGWEEADGVWTDQPGCVCGVLTADCLPILLCQREGSAVAAVHAGWRGLADGIVHEAMKQVNAQPGEWLAWIGPAIRQAAFEVGEEVREAFSAQPGFEAFFKPAARAGYWMADLPGLAQAQLDDWGAQVTLSGLCTYQDAHDYFSFRRESETGRMLTGILIAPS